MRRFVCSNLVCIQQIQIFSHLGPIIVGQIEYWSEHYSILYLLLRYMLAPFELITWMNLANSFSVTCPYILFKGIGRGIALKLVECWAKVVAVARTQEELGSLKEEVINPSTHDILVLVTLSSINGLSKHEDMRMLISAFTSHIHKAAYTCHYLTYIPVWMTSVHDPFAAQTLCEYKYFWSYLMQHTIDKHSLYGRIILFSWQQLPVSIRKG